MNGWPRRARWAAGVVVALALAGTFALYTRPDFLMALGNQLWACF